MPRSATKKITALAEALGIPYSRLQRMLTGYTVMQLEDLGRLYSHIGSVMELWFLTGQNAGIAETIGRARASRATIRSVATHERPTPGSA